MIYFTSDMHLGHEAIIRMQNRPFENAEEMNRILIENYNSVVQKNDTVYFGIRRYDVGVEANNYMPVSIRQIEEFFATNLE